MSAIKGLEQQLRNLGSISNTAVPKAFAMAINRVAATAISTVAREVATQTKVPQKRVKERVKIKKATAKETRARVTVNRGDFPVIKLGSARMVLSRRRRKKGRRLKTQWSGSVLTIGKRRFHRAFIQQLKNGRWHVMQREGKGRYPIDVVKIPMATPLTTAFNENMERIRLDRLPKEMTYAIKRQVSLAIKRWT
ncbi:phage tail protein [Salmonella enterica]|uniref:phage tail protein n=1 Tax=Salmonella enterica TaxID=28901 RepID=UPI0009B04495|nr:phage tail protein [Salmonella enterica]EBU8701244.1 phage tail protein [Salmonella enterica subsp. enterica serovar Kokomlemle]EGJ5835177.1 phage tail protein [Salmonella enterica]